MTDKELRIASIVIARLKLGTGVVLDDNSDIRIEQFAIHRQVDVPNPPIILYRYLDSDHFIEERVCYFFKEALKTVLYELKRAEIDYVVDTTKGE